MEPTPEPSRVPLWRRPLVWGVLLMLGVAGGIAIGVSIGWRAAVGRSLMSVRCEPLEAVDLGVPELVALKARWKAYVRDPSPTATLSLSPREATFLLQAESDLGVWLEGDGSSLHARLTAPVEGGCYNVEYQGDVFVQDGLAVLDPQRLLIGGMDLSDLTGLGGALGGTKHAISPEDIEDPTLRDRLGNIESLRVRDGGLQVRFLDPDRVWR